MIRHLEHAEELGQFCTHDLGESIAISPLPYPHLFLPVPLQLHSNLPNVRGYQGALKPLQRGFSTREVTYQDFISVTYQVIFH